MQVGFTIVSRGHGTEAHCFGTTRGERLVHFFEDGADAALLIGRLHYRQPLLDQAERTGTAARMLGSADNDAALALAAYRAGGPPALSRLEGDFALALWDGQTQTLFGARDPLGGYPLYWTKTRDLFALSTSLGRLRKLKGDCRLDLNYVADYIMVPRWSLPETEDGRCAFEDIHRILAGSVVGIRLPGGKPKQYQCWNWLERVVDPETDRLEELAVRYRELFLGAVRERCHGTTAAHLSGGMDSTAVCLTAHRLSRTVSGAAPVHALSMVYDRLTGLARETSFIDLVAAPDGMISQRILGDDLLDFDSFRDSPPYDEPCPWLWRTTMERAMLDRAAAIGADTVLSGVGADEMVDLAPYHLTDLLRRGRVWAAWKEAARWGKADNCSRWKYLYPFGVAPLLPVRVRAGLKAWFRGGFSSWEKLNEWTIAPWVRPEFARRHHLQERGLANMRRIFRTCAAPGLSQALYAISDHVNDFSRWHLAAPRGIVLSHPFLDPRLLAFGLGLQTRYRPEPERRKPILTEALRDILPEKIRSRKNKVPFNEVYYLGLSRNLPALESLVRQSKPAAGDMFDLDVLVDCLRKAALGAASGLTGLIRLNTSLTLLHWLAQKDQVAESRPYLVKKLANGSELTE